MNMLSYSTGFTVIPRSEITEEVIQQVPNPAAAFSWDTYSLMSGKREKRIADLVAKSVVAYTVDGLVRQSVDKYAEMFKDFDFDGEEEAVKYLKMRLKMISINVDEHWKTFLTRIIHEFFKTGNAMVLKVRGGGPVDGVRPLYKNKPYSVSGLYLISAERLEPVIDNKSGAMIGWKLNDTRKVDNLQLVIPGAKVLDSNKALLKRMKPDSRIPVLLPGIDIVQIAYKKGADSNYGFGLTLAALEDVASWRNLELNTLVMCKKFSNPIIHHKIIKPASPLSGSQNEINAAYKLHLMTPVDGVIITGGNHEIKAVGAESQALRVEGYLKYFAARACAGVGTSPYIMGMEPATLGTAEAATEILLAKVRFCQQDISRQIEMGIFNELLWEGGFDPFREEDDEVHLEFADVDQDRTIKQQTHAADQYNKGLIDHEEARTLANHKGTHKEELLYHNKVQIPVDKAKAEAKGEQDIKVAKAKPKPKSSKEFAQLALPLVPNKEGDIGDYLLLLERRFGYNKEKLEQLYEPLLNLIGDEEAILAYTYQELELNA